MPFAPHMPGTLTHLPFPSLLPTLPCLPFQCHHTPPPTPPYPPPPHKSHHYLPRSLPSCCLCLPPKKHLTFWNRLRIFCVLGLLLKTSSKESRTSPSSTFLLGGGWLGMPSIPSCVILSVAAAAHGGQARLGGRHLHLF